MRTDDIQETTSMRKLASVVAIATAEPIPDTDGLDVVTMEG